METLLNYFENWLLETQTLLKKYSIEEISKSKDKVGEKRRLIINHKKKFKFGQISVCEDNNITIEIINDKNGEILFSNYFKSDKLSDIDLILKEYLNEMKN